MYVILHKFIYQITLNTSIGGTFSSIFIEIIGSFTRVRKKVRVTLEGSECFGDSTKESNVYNKKK